MLIALLYCLTSRNTLAVIKQTTHTYE